VLKSELNKTKARLIEALKCQLPGERAHRLMLPHGRELYPAPGKNDTVQSSILMLLFPYNEKVSTCLIRRPSSMRNHAGQIAFPGGKVEPFDKNLIDTALRESSEEIGTDTSHVEIIGALTPLYVNVSNFIINPFIGWSDTIPQFKFDNQEVDEIFIVPVENFSNHTANQRQEVTTTRGTFEVPGFFINKLFVWGATAMIISEFNEIFHQYTDIDMLNIK
jgi:8-oxo-dGTP pyrophosphatase MutT (NUDIX family)